MTQASNASPTGTGAQGAGAQGAGVIDQAKDTAQHLAGQVKEQVGQRAQTGFDQAKTRAADTLTGVAQTLRMTTQQLQDQKQAAFATPYVDRAAEQVEQLANYVRTADVQELTERTEDVARRQPAIFLGGLFALGLAGARFLKSSRRNETPQGSGSTGRSYPNYGGGRSGGGYGAGYGASYGGTSAGTGSAGSYGDVTGSGTYGGGIGSSAGTGTTDVGSMGTGTAGAGTMDTGTIGTGSTGTGSMGTSAGTPSTGGSGLTGGAGLGTSGRGDI